MSILWRGFYVCLPFRWIMRDESLREAIPLELTEKLGHHQEREIRDHSGDTQTPTDQNGRVR